MFEVSSEAWEKRDMVRVPVDINAWLFHDGLGEAFSVKNVSSHGALLLGAYFPKIGSRVELSTDQLNVEAEVRWVDQGSCGLLFRRRVNVSDFLEI